MIIKIPLILITLICAVLPQATNTLPYAAAGLTSRQAAAHLLSRLTYGPRPGDINRLLHMGLENWLEKQLHGVLPDEDVETRLASDAIYEMSMMDVFNTYRRLGLVAREAQKEGVLAKGADVQSPEIRQQLKAYGEKKGYRPLREVINGVRDQKVYRAVHSHNQLREVLTEFWINHFNVPITHTRANICIYSYERDAIRPNALGRFGDLLAATAKHPAMLLYLNNAQSIVPSGELSTLEYLRRGRGKRGLRNKQLNELLEDAKRNRRGINENYARELMELHTLGVDGGYTQQDVQALARVFSGWGVMPSGQLQQLAEKRLQRVGRFGFVREGAFLFRADHHDARAKTVLGVAFPEGGGIEEGQKMLRVLADHAATASFISRQLAIRFVCDEPPRELIDRMAQTYHATGGDIRQVMRVLVYSPEFWAAENLRAKIKSPFELAISSLRILDAELRFPERVIRWVAKMGQPMYAYQAPTGYPDRGEVWINTGSLLNRMNYGLNLLNGKIGGIGINVAALNENREPESLLAALETYGGLLLPERDLQPTIDALTPVIFDPLFAQRVENAANQDTSAVADAGDNQALQEAPGKKNLAQVVGVIIGSPEFQRR